MACWSHITTLPSLSISSLEKVIDPDKHVVGGSQGSKDTSPAWISKEGNQGMASFSRGSEVKDKVCLSSV